MRLSKNFVLSEFTKSDTGTRLGIDNTPPPQAVENLKLLVALVLQPLADHFKTVTVNSGFRSLELNKAIGGATNSQHLSGLAADIEVPGVSNYDLACWIRDNLKFDQLILEYYTPGNPSSGWVHVSISSGKLRKEVLTIGKTIRKAGLHA
jgi:uncharacterized protein YcbK (DUF882 family)